MKKKNLSTGGRGLNKDSLYRFLYVVFRKDVGRKGMALLLAMILWVYLDAKVVIRRPQYVTIQVVHGEDKFIEFSNKAVNRYFIVIPPNFMLTENLEDTRLEVTLSGTKELIQSTLIGRKEIHSNFLDGYDKRTWKHQFYLEDFNVLKDRPNTKVDFSPKYIQLHLAKRGSAGILLSRANVELRGEEELAEKGIYVEDVSFDPNYITIEGPKPEVDLILKDNALLKFEPIQLQETGLRTHSGSVELSSDLLEKKISLRKANQTVGFTVSLVEEEQERVLSDVDVVVKFKADLLTPEQLSRIALDQDKVTVTLTGPQSQITLLANEYPGTIKEKIMVFIDLNERADGMSIEELLASDQLEWGYIPGTMRDIKWLDPSIEIKVEPESITVSKVESQ